jgi:DHA1 family bicyclomycin/chloramphenicol resistance-like MFS transporter
LLGAAQFGAGAAIAPLFGVLGNSEPALALVITISVVIALVAMSLVRAPATSPAVTQRSVVAEPA